MGRDDLPSEESESNAYQKQHPILKDPDGIPPAGFDFATHLGLICASGSDSSVQTTEN